MACNIISVLNDIFLIRLLETTIVMEHISDTVIISLVRNNSDMVFKDHDITALPLAEFLLSETIPIWFSKITISPPCHWLIS